MSISGWIISNEAYSEDNHMLSCLYQWMNTEAFKGWFCRYQVPLNSCSLHLFFSAALAQCCSCSGPDVTPRLLVILTGPQSLDESVIHFAGWDVSGCSLSSLTQPWNPGMFYCLWLHMGEGESTRPDAHSPVTIVFLWMFKMS